MSPKKIILWGGWYGSKNVGDQALLLAITDLLGDAHPDAQFTTLTARPEHVCSYAARDSRLDIRAIHTRLEFPRVVRAFAECDLFIFGGAVPFFEHPPQVLAMTILTALARLFRVPSFLWSVSSQRVTSRLAKRAFGWVLNGASGVTYRDEFTRRLFLDCGLPDERMSLGGDSALLMHTAPAESALDLLARAGWRIGGRPLVALTPRTLRPADGEAETHYTPKTSQQYQKEIDVYAAVLDDLWERGFQPIFVPMNTVAPDDDREASRCIMQKARHGAQALIVDEEIPPRLAAAVYAHCRASLVSRVHGSIMSFKANCPVVMYAFDQKHVGIMTEIGLAEFILRPETDGADCASEMLMSLLSNPQSVRADLARRFESAAQKSLHPLHLALDILSQP